MRPSTLTADEASELPEVTIRRSAIAVRVPLLDWLSEPSSTCGVHVMRGRQWEFRAYTALADQVRGVSRQLQETGVATGDVVGVLTNDPFVFLTGCFGTLHAGATVLPVPPPNVVRSRYDEYLGGVLELAQPKVVLAVGDVSAAIIDTAMGCRARPEVLEPVDDSVPVFPAAPPAGIAALQLTSGSTGSPRAVRLTWDNLEVQMAMVRTFLRWEPDDAAASWLPLHHDMGLIGLFLTAVCSSAPLWQMVPQQFLLSPIEWLECFGRFGAAHTAAPPFGYDYVARHVRPEQLDGLDLSGWRSAVVGAERIWPATLRRFAELVGPAGFSDTALRPAYGLAEATLAVTGHTLHEPPRIARIAASPARVGARAEVVDECSLADAPEDLTGFMVSSGRPLQGVAVSVVDESGATAHEGTLGEIVIRSPSLAAGYHRSDRTDVPDSIADTLATGDVGFMLGGELFVLGRISDSLSVRGQQLLVEDIEGQINDALRPWGVRCVIVPTHLPDFQCATIVVEAVPGTWTKSAAVAFRHYVGSGVRVVVCAVPPKSIPVTTSGKPRRRELARQLAEGQLSILASFSESACMGEGGR